MDLSSQPDGAAALSITATESGKANAGPVCRDIVIDNTAPTATIVLDSSSIAVGSTATATITLSDAPASGTAFDASDITVTGVAPPGAVTKGTFTPTANTDDKVYTLVLNGMAATTTAATITVVQGAFQDSLGRSNAAVTETLSVSTTPPTTTPTFSVPGDGDTVGGSAVTVSGTGGSGAAVAVSLSPTGNNPCAAGTNLNPAGASLNPAIVSSGGWSTTVDLSSQSDGAAVLSITATESGKANAGPVCRDIVIDNTAPTATLELDQSSIAVGTATRPPLPLRCLMRRRQARRLMPVTSR